MKPRCEDCWYFDYDEEQDVEVCRMDLDEDEWYHIHSDPQGRCPFFRPGGEYTLPRKQ